jgi:hypothetical protein
MIIRIIFISFFVYMIFNSINFCNYELTEKNIIGPVKLHNKESNEYTLQYLIRIKYNIDKNNNTNYCINSNDIKINKIYTSDYSMALAYNPIKYENKLENNLNIILYVLLFIPLFFSFCFY